MKHLGRGLAVLVALAGLFWPVVFTDTGGDAGADDPATITDLRVELTVTPEGTLHAVETVTTEMPPGRHGIFRFWDVADVKDPHARALPRDITVGQDNGPAQVELSWERQHRFRVARIGDPDVYLAPGRHVYRLGYTVDGVLDGGADGRSRFYWDVVPVWPMPIRHAEIGLHLPAGTGGAPTRCAVGVGLTGGCRVQGEGRDYRVVVDGLAPRTPVTVDVPVDVAPPARATLPWPPRLDPVLGRSVPLAVALAVLAGVGALLGLALGWRSHEEPPGLPLQYAPPEGVGPVQAAYVVTEEVPDGALEATLFQMAQQGLTAFERTEGGTWVVRGTGSAAQWAATDPVTRRVGESLGVTDRLSFAADGSVGQGKQLLATKSEMERAVRSWARTEGLLRWSVPEQVGRLLVYAAVVLAGLGFFLNPFDVTLMGAPPAAFAIGGLVLVLPGAVTRRTAKGRELWSRAGGFARILSTPSAEQRFEFSGREDLYTAFIPWAVAFGCAEEWQRKYETEMGRPAPTPVWLAGPGPYGGPAAVADVMDSFASSLSSSISAYQATQSSSGGGGGFSGGGGGGGGGGGSW